jgi:hypothetical protein
MRTKKPKVKLPAKAKAFPKLKTSATHERSEKQSMSREMPAGVPMGIAPMRGRFPVRSKRKV